MKKKWRGSPMVLAVLLAGAMALRLAGEARPPYQSGALPSAAYLWQRSWSEDVEAALARTSGVLDGYTALGTEIEWRAGGPHALRFELRYDWLQATGVPCGLALRIGPFSGPFRRDDDICGFLVSEALGLLERARTAGLTLAELQLDFDCATSKLAGYRVWVDEIKRALHPLPIAVTVLPSWMRSGQFRPLVRAAGSFVLQVHSLEPPRGIDAPLVLCDSVAARRWVRTASRAGVPFRVALPTYGYQIGFDPDGKFIGLAADGSRRGWPAGTRLRTARPDSEALARLVADWIRRRSSLFEGLIWYRLPVGHETLNWSWPTVKALTEGRAPVAHLEAVARRTGSGPVDISLVNSGEGDAELAVRITVSWASARLVACDALAGFDIARKTATTVTFATTPDAAPGRLLPQDSRSAGWIRLDRKEAVDVELEASGS